MKSDTLGSLESEFERLIGRHDVAWQRYRNSHAMVARKFMAAFAGRSRENPTAIELDAEQSAWQAVAEVKAQIKNLMERLRAL